MFAEYCSLWAFRGKPVHRSDFRPVSGMLVIFIKFNFISNRLLLIALDERYYTVGPLLVPVLSGLLVYNIPFI